MIQQTSLLAFSNIRKDLPARQGQVLDCIEQYGPIANKTIAQMLNLPINSITGRVLELRRKQLVELARVDMSAEHRRVMFWRAV